MSEINITEQFLWIIFENRMYFIENHNAIIISHILWHLLFFYKHVFFAWSSSCLWFFWFQSYAFIRLETNRICCLGHNLITKLEEPTRIHHRKYLELDIQWCSLKYSHVLNFHSNVRLYITYRLLFFQHIWSL